MSCRVGWAAQLESTAKGARMEDGRRFAVPGSRRLGVVAAATMLVLLSACSARLTRVTGGPAFVTAHFDRPARGRHLLADADGRVLSSADASGREVRFPLPAAPPDGFDGRGFLFDDSGVVMRRSDRRGPGVVLLQPWVGYARCREALASYGDGGDASQLRALCADWEELRVVA